MKYVYEFDNNRLTDYENKPITIGDTDQQVYQGVWEWNGRHHRRAYDC